MFRDSISFAMLSTIGCRVSIVSITVCQLTGSMPKMCWKALGGVAYVQSAVINAT